MSSTSLLPTRGAENSIYLAFSSVLVAIGITETLPNLFDDDLRAYITIVLVGASLVAGLLFYTKPERGVTLILQKMLLQKRKQIEVFIARTLLLTRAWEWSVSEFPSLEKEAEYIVGTLNTDSALHSDIWVIKGACYFAVTAYLLPILLTLHPPYSFLLPLVIVSTLIVSILWRYRNFLNIICMVLQIRYLEDRVRADATARQVRSRLGYNITEPIAKLEVDYKSGLLTHLEDILKILENRQWERFGTRFKMLNESSESFTNTRLHEGYNDHIQTWANALRDYNMNPEVNCWIRFKNEKKVLSRLCDVTDFKSSSSLKKILKLKNIRSKMVFFRNVDPQNLDIEGLHTIANLISLTASKPKDIRSLSKALMGWIDGSEYAMNLTLKILFQVPFRNQKPLLDEIGCLIQPGAANTMHGILHRGASNEGRIAARIIGGIRDPARISNAIINLRSVAYGRSDVGIECLSAISQLKQRIGDTRLDDCVLDTLKYHGGEKLYVALHIMEKSNLDTTEIETIKHLLAKKLITGSIVINGKSTEYLNTLSKIDFEYPDIPPEFIRILLNIKYDKEENPIPKVTAMRALESSRTDRRDTYCARILSESGIVGSFTYSEIAELLHNNNESVNAIGFLLLRDEHVKGEVPTALPLKVIGYLGHDKPLLRKLAASTIGIRQDIMTVPFIQHVRTHRPYSNHDVILALGCLGTNLADYPDIVQEFLSGIDGGDHELAMTLLNALSKLADIVQEFPNVLAYLEKRLRNLEVTRLSLISLLEVSGAILGPLSFTTLISRIKRLKSPWIYDVGMASIAEIEERTGNVIN